MIQCDDDVVNHFFLAAASWAAFFARINSTSSYKI